MASILDSLINSNPQLAEQVGGYTQETAQESSVFNQEDFDLFSGAAHVDTSSSAAFVKNFSETDPLLQSSKNYLVQRVYDEDMQKFAEISPIIKTVFSKLKFKDDNNEFSVIPKTMSLEEYYGDDFPSLSEDEKRQRMAEVKAEEMVAQYGHVVSEGSPLASGAGVLAGYMADPSTLLPLGQTTKAAFGIGAAIGATDVGMEQLAKEGKASATDMAIAALIGGSVGAAIQKAGELFMPWLRGKLDKGEPVTSEEILESFPNVGREVSEDIARAVEGEWIPKGAEAYQKHSTNNLKRLMDFRPDVELRDYGSIRIQDMPLEGEFLGKAGKGIKGYPDVILKDSGIKRLSETKKLTGPDTENIRTSTQEGIMDQRLAAITGDLPEEIAKEMKLLENHQRAINEGKIFISKNHEKKLWQEALLLKSHRVEDIFKKGKLAAPPTPLELRVEKEISEAFKDLSKKEKQDMANDISKSFDYMEKDLDIKRAADLQGKSEFEKKKLFKEMFEEEYEIESVVDRTLIGLEDNVTSLKEFVKKTRNPESGFATDWLMRDLASASIGGLGGYAYSGGDIDTALMWAIASGALAHGVGHLGPALYKHQGKMKPYFKEVTEDVAERWSKHYSEANLTTRPSEHFKNVAGATGHRFASLLQRMQEDIRSRMSEDLIDIEQALSKNGVYRGTPEYDAVSDVLRDSSKLGMAPERVRKSAEFVREKLNATVREAMGRGVVKTADGLEMMQRALRKGYFPRVYDKYFLATKEGKDKWFETLKNYQWTEDEIRKAAESVAGEKNLNFERFKRSKDGKYTVDNEFINQLYRYQGKATFSNRSTHLNKERKIKLPDKVLEPFLVNDLMDVLTSYFHDTQKRIQSANYFGVNDEGMHRIIDEMKYLGVSSNDRNAAWEVYWSSVGDPASNNIKTAMNMSQELRSFYSNMTALQTFNLLFAQTLNITQATANGLIYLSSREGLKSPLTILKGMSRTLVKEKKNEAGNLIWGRDWAERIGAAAENTILQVAGEMGSLESKSATKFLSATGFLKVEEIQRKLAANIGRAYVEGLLDQKSKLLAKKTKQGPGESIEKALKKVDAHLFEMGIGAGTPPSKVTLAQFDRAGQRFSNTTNFVNTPDQIPIWWNSPHAKMFRQFKTFMFHHGALLVDNVWKPIKKRDVRPIFAMAAAGGIGMAPSELRKWLMADDEDYSATERYIQGFQSIGGLGLFFQTIQQAEHGMGKITAGLAGPTISMIDKLATGAYQTATKSIEEGEFVHEPLTKAIVDMPIAKQVFDISGVASQVGEKFDINVLKEMPTRKEIKEELSTKKSDPYSIYDRTYK